MVDVPIRVFNRKFIVDNVFRSDGDMAPIYVFGEHNVEKQKEVDALKKGLELQRQQLLIARSEKRWGCTLGPADPKGCPGCASTTCT